MKNNKITSFIYFIIGLLFAFGPKTIFKVCKVGDTPMKCYWSTKALIGIAVIFLVISILFYLAKTLREKVLLTILAIASGIVAILIPSILIGGCGMKTMDCRSKTFPFVYLISLALIIYSSILLFYLIRSESRRINEKAGLTDSSGISETAKIIES